jgi:hypothetical protein
VFSTSNIHTNDVLVKETCFIKKNQEKNEKNCFFTLFSLKMLQNVQFSSNLLNFFEIRLLVAVSIIRSRLIFAKS